MYLWMMGKDAEYYLEVGGRIKDSHGVLKHNAQDKGAYVIICLESSALN